MGRTQKPPTPIFEEEIQRLSGFRRSLRQEDQQLFDELVVTARQHLYVLPYVQHPFPSVPILTTFALEERKYDRRQDQRVELLLRRIAKLEKRLAVLEADDA